jgi:hypothetical protein
LANYRRLCEKRNINSAFSFLTHLVHRLAILHRNHLVYLIPDVPQPVLELFTPQGLFYLLSLHKGVNMLSLPS